MLLNTLIINKDKLSIGAKLLTNKETDNKTNKNIDG